jgi:GalNAc-alpha-(1->4)-GalNAc-alpha-(1->3)-diNAcBac-PP-undecaprenol alpha-1,4-N-acetyl-D-galactosaminyltransferase
MQSTSTRPVRIALTIHALFGGGAERLMSQLASRWSAAGHEVHLVTWSTPDTDQYAVPSAVRRHGLGLLAASTSPVSGLLANLRRVRVLRTTLQNIQPDLLLSFCDQMNIVTLQAARRLSAPVIVSEHSNPAKQRLSRIWEAWRSHTYPSCSRCVVLTDEIAQYVQRWVRADKVYVIPAAIDPPTQRPPATRSNTLILAVGRLSPEKGFDLLIEAWRRIHQQLPGWELHIAGAGSELAALTELARGLPSVKLLGWIPNAWPLYQQATLFVLPSRYEGFPVALVEALSQGCPSIATRCTEATLRPPLSDALELVDTDSSGQLAAAIVRLAERPEKRDELSVAGIRASLGFHWDTIGRLWDQLLEQYQGDE